MFLVFPQGHVLVKISHLHKMKQVTKRRALYFRKYEYFIWDAVLVLYSYTLCHAIIFLKLFILLYYTHTSTCFRAY